MGKNKVLLSVFCGLFSVLLNAQNPVVYRNYENYESKILHSLKESGAVSKFTPMHSLKLQTKNVKESTIIQTNLVNAKVKKIPCEKIVADNTEDALMVVQYCPKLIYDEKVGVIASAVVLSDDGVCVTNYHVLKSLIDSNDKLTPLDSVLFVATESGKIYSITSVLSYNKEADIALFKIDTKGEKIKATNIGNDLPAGAEINMLTHPEWHHFYYSKGVVARDDCSNENDPFTNRMEVTADYAKGSSGGPAYDECGNLVGIASTTQSIYYVDNPQTNLQMVVKSIIPISSIKKLIKKVI
jgi:serine protease Do